MTTQQEVIEYKVVSLTVKEQKRWEGILCGLGREGWVLSGTVPLIDSLRTGYPNTTGVECIMMRSAPLGQRIGLPQPQTNSVADALVRGSGAPHTG